MGWDEIRHFLARANIWTGKQTFSNIAVTGGTISGATITETFTASEDPALNAAVTTAIVDAFNGVVVTLSAAGNTQTLQNPTTAATIRKFMVINNDTSNNNLSVVAHSVTFTLTPGEGQCFLWDGSDWGPTDLGITDIPVTVTQGGTGASTASEAFTNLKQQATTLASGVTVYSGSTKAIAGKDTASAMTPADTKAVLDSRLPTENLIGVPGAMGFGVGICPPANLPDGMVGMPGYDQLGSDNYGNYIYKEGSVMIWVPRFYYRIAHASNPTYATYGVNSIDIKGIDTYPTTALANAAGYALHRAFVDGGVEKLGFFRDKYKCSKVANGTGFTAASIKNGLPLSSYADHNPFSGLTGGANFYYSAIDLAHRRDGVDGAVNASSIFFCSSQFLRSAIVMLSLAHGQAATSTANCAWYHATYNYPKGCNNNALKDVDDTTVAWESDGYDNCGKTGSAGYGGGAGNVFAKSTHNGQNCGSADDNGFIYEISIGTTCIASTKAIEAISRANPCEITITGHGLVNGDIMQIGTAITQADWVGLNSKVWPITKTGDNTFTVAFNSSAFGTAYDCRS
jgi:hypothetical protein